MLLKIESKENTFAPILVYSKFHWNFKSLTCSYTQQKYNLFREESEGYAKLITELNREDVNVANAHILKERVLALIGKNFLENFPPAWKHFFLYIVNLFEIFFSHMEIFFKENLFEIFYPTLETFLLIYRVFQFRSK